MTRTSELGQTAAGIGSALNHCNTPNTRQFAEGRKALTKFILLQNPKTARISLHLHMPVTTMHKEVKDVTFLLKVSCDTRPLPTVTFPAAPHHHSLAELVTSLS